MDAASDDVEPGRLDDDFSSQARQWTDVRAEPGHAADGQHVEPGHAADGEPGHQDSIPATGPSLSNDKRVGGGERGSRTVTFAH